MNSKNAIVQDPSVVFASGSPPQQITQQNQRNAPQSQNQDKQKRKKPETREEDSGPSNL